MGPLFWDLGKHYANVQDHAVRDLAVISEPPEVRRRHDQYQKNQDRSDNPHRKPANAPGGSHPAPLAPGARKDPEEEDEERPSIPLQSEFRNEQRKLRVRGTAAARRKRQFPFETQPCLTSRMEGTSSAMPSHCSHTRLLPQFGRFGMRTAKPPSVQSLK